MTHSLTYTPCRLPLSKRKFKQVFRSLRAPPFAFTRSALSNHLLRLRAHPPVLVPSESFFFEKKINPIYVLWRATLYGGQYVLVYEGTSRCVRYVMGLSSPQSPANPHASNHSPSLTSAVLSSNQVYHSYLPAPSSALSSPSCTRS